jgi:hypothetical protein
MAKKFVAPENLQELEADALEASVNEAMDRAKEIRPADGSTPDAETLEELRAITGFLSAAKVENETRVAAEAEIQAELAQLDSLLEEGIAPAGDEEEADEVIPGEDDQPAEEVPAEEEEAAAAPAGELVSANRKVKAPAFRSKASLAARAAKAAPEKAAPSTEMQKVNALAKLFAANDVPGYKSGQQFEDFSAASGAILSRLNTLPEGYQANTRIQANALQIQLPENSFSTANPQYKGKDITELINDAANEKRLSGGSLVAAGGWGAPSERSLDFCDIESLDGLISVPEVTITRGGLEWTRGPSFGDVVNSSTGFWDMTEAVAEAGTELKTSIRPEVPEFEEARLDAVGVMMENGLLLRQGWPELVERWAKLTLLAHQYKLNQKKINQIRGLIGNAVNITNGFGNALDLLHILEMVANGERQRLMLSPTQTLEVVAPWWAKSVMRVDLAQRTGIDSITVTDAQLESHFTARNLKVQWIKGLQDLVLDPTTGLALTYPDTLEVFMYPAGAFVAGVAPVISLDTIYDSTNLKKNDYVHLFVEQGVLMTNPCYDGRRITLPFLANGRRAATSDGNDNFANAPVA